jgi:hypothetical protein
MKEKDLDKILRNKLMEEQEFPFVEEDWISVASRLNHIPTTPKSIWRNTRVLSFFSILFLVHIGFDIFYYLQKKSLHEQNVTQVINTVVPTEKIIAEKQIQLDFNKGKKGDFVPKPLMQVNQNGSLQDKINDNETAFIVAKTTNIETTYDKEKIASNEPSNKIIVTSNQVESKDTMTAISSASASITADNILFEVWKDSLQFDKNFDKNFDKAFEEKLDTMLSVLTLAKDSLVPPINIQASYNSVSNLQNIDNQKDKNKKRNIKIGLNTGIQTPIFSKKSIEYSHQGVSLVVRLTKPFGKKWELESNVGYLRGKRKLDSDIGLNADISSFVQKKSLLQNHAILVAFRGTYFHYLSPKAKSYFGLGLGSQVNLPNTVVHSVKYANGTLEKFNRPSTFNASVEPIVSFHTGIEQVLPNTKWQYVIGLDLQQYLSDELKLIQKRSLGINIGIKRSL